MRSPALAMSWHIYRKFPGFLWKVYKFFETKKSHETLQMQAFHNNSPVCDRYGVRGCGGLAKALKS